MNVLEALLPTDEQVGQRPISSCSMVQSVGQAYPGLGAEDALPDQGCLSVAAPRSWFQEVGLRVRRQGPTSRATVPSSGKQSEEAPPHARELEARGLTGALKQHEFEECGTCRP